MQNFPSTNRYFGKPFLKVLESYVLWAIGELPPDSIASLKLMEPKLIESLGQKDKTKTWQEAVEHQLELSPDFRVTVMDYWVKNQRIAQQNNLRLTPIDFAMMFVDTNFNT